MSGTIRYTIAGGIWVLIVGFGVLLILALPSKLGFPRAALWMGALLITINLMSSIFFVGLARQATKHKVLRIFLIIAAAVFGYWMAIGIMGILLTVPFGQTHLPDWLGMTIYVTAEMLAPVVLLSAIIGIIVSVTKIIVDGIKTKRRGQGENVG